MPKKFKGTNSKAVEARERKAATKHAEDERRRKEEEDKLWEDDDKHVNRKLQRKEERERKRCDQQSRKKELAELAETDIASGPAKVKKGQPTVPKVTRAQVEERTEERRMREAGAAAQLPAKGGRVVDVDEQPLEENVNRLVLEGEEARTVEDAIKVLNISGDAEPDRHPEKRMRAAYAAFEAARLPVLKAEQPHLRLSQWKQILRKEWQRSPENPVNKELLES